MTNTTTKKFTARQLTKAGFTRVPEMDFRDDGTTFRVFEYAGIYVTYATWTDKNGNREVFLDAEPDRKRQYSFSYTDYRDAEWVDLCGEFNGVPENQVNVEKLAANCRIISEEVKKLEEKVLNEIVDPVKLQSIRDEEITFVLEAIEYYKKNFNWFEASDFDIRDSKRDVQRALSYIEYLKNHPIKDMSFRDQRYISQKVAHNDWTDGSLGSYRKSILRAVAKSKKEEN